MRVLTVGNMYPPHHLGGAELIWRSSVEQLREAGHRVRVLTSDYVAAGPDAAIPEAEDVHRELPSYWCDHQFPRYGPRARLRIERTARGVLERHLDDLRPEVVCWWSMGGLPISLLAAPPRRRIPALGVLLDDWLLYAPLVDGWRKLCRRLGPLGGPARRLTGTPVVELGAVARWIFMSEALRSRAREGGVGMEDSAVLHRGVEASEFEPLPDRGWSGRLLYLGRIDRRKGIRLAIEALRRLPDCTLEVVGDGDRAHLAELEALAGERGLSGRVVFDRVPRSEVPERLAAADALLFPVLWEEPWGLVPLEAMAAGTPVVATGTGGSGEYLEDGRNCLIYEPRGDAAALAGAVARLRDDGLREALRRGGLETTRRFSERGFNEGIESALRELTG